LLKFWGKKSQKFHLGLDLAEFLSFVFSKIGQENLLNHSFMLCFLVLGKNSQDTKIRHNKLIKKIWNLHILFLENA
jgi:hypothetical protein